MTSQPKSGSNVTTPKTGNYPGKQVNLRFSDDFSSDRNFFVSKPREISRLNIPPRSEHATTQHTKSWSKYTTDKKVETLIK